jgi:hypothetical protein
MGIASWGPRYPIMPHIVASFSCQQLAVSF